MWLSTIWWTGLPGARILRMYWGGDNQCHFDDVTLLISIIALSLCFMFPIGLYFALKRENQISMKRLRRKFQVWLY